MPTCTRRLSEPPRRPAIPGRVGTGHWARRGGRRSPEEGGIRAGARPLDPGSPRSGAMRRRPRSTCAPVRAALARLRVANGVKWGRGREEVEAPERRKRRGSVPRSLESVGGGGCRQAQRGELPSVPAQLEVARAEPGRETPLDAQDRAARPERPEPRRRRGETLMGRGAARLGRRDRADPERLPCSGALLLGRDRELSISEGGSAPAPGDVSGSAAR